MHPFLALTVTSGIFVFLAIVVIGFFSWLIVREIRKGAVKTLETPENIVSAFAKAPGELADGLARAVKDFCNITPQVTINTKVIHAQTSEILEVATASQNIHLSKRVEDKWMFSKKTLTYSAVFRVKAGFDLTQPFRIQVLDNPLRAKVVIGQPKVLSVEQLDVDMKESGGWWNNISANDREQLLNSLRDEVQRHSEVSTLLADAKRNFEMRLTQAAVEKNAAIDFEYLALAAA